jgi:hypothetical protein
VLWATRATAANAAIRIDRFVVIGVMSGPPFRTVAHGIAGAMLTSIVGVIKNKVYLNGLRLENYTSHST